MEVRMLLKGEADRMISDARAGVHEGQKVVRYGRTVALRAISNSDSRMAELEKHDLLYGMLESVLKSGFIPKTMNVCAEDVTVNSLLDSMTFVSLLLYSGERQIEVAYSFSEDSFTLRQHDLSSADQGGEGEQLGTTAAYELILQQFYDFLFSEKHDM